MRAGVRSIEHGSLMDDEAIELMAERGTYLVADMYDGDYMLEVGPSLGYTDEVHREGAPHERRAARGVHEVREGRRAHARSAPTPGIAPHGGQRAAVRVLRALTGSRPCRRIQSATTVVRRADALGRPGGHDRARACSPTWSRCPGDPTDDVTLLEDVPFVMKGGEVVKGDR